MYRAIRLICIASDALMTSMSHILDESFRALSNPARRRLLVAMAEQHAQSDTVVHPTEDANYSELDERRIAIEMHHTHLPVLEEAGLITCECDERKIGRGPNFNDIRPILTYLKDDPDQFTVEA